MVEGGGAAARRQEVALPGAQRRHLSPKVRAARRQDEVRRAGGRPQRRAGVGCDHVRGDAHDGLRDEEDLHRQLLEAVQGHAGRQAPDQGPQEVRLRAHPGASGAGEGEEEDADQGRKNQDQGGQGQDGGALLDGHPRLPHGEERQLPRRACGPLPRPRRAPEDGPDQGGHPAGGHQHELLRGRLPSQVRAARAQLAERGAQGRDNVAGLLQGHHQWGVQVHLLVRWQLTQGPVGP
mmetsp:Transcript_47906/g.116662  ORF Transcript_47906/g.116662 Transcript_47906/m.116662 type:complete len:236 (-) Transcript_47906:1482-2189(-)